MPDYPLGRQPANPTKPKLRLRRALGERPTAPLTCDWLSVVPRWNMFSNDQVGCCTCASIGHVAVEVDKNGQLRDLALTDQDILTAYSAISGYDPARPETDVGATLQDALDYWRKTGIAGNTIAAFAWIDAQDLELVRACIATFGAVYTGMWMPASAMDQLDRGQPWTLVGRSPILGGHCVPLGAYDEESFTCVTWGQTQRMDVPFYLRYFDEVTCVVDLDWLRSTGLSPAGIDVATLNEDFEILTGQSGPFPAYEPPAPEPTPEPVPADNPDAELVAAFTKWQAAKGLE